MPAITQLRHCSDAEAVPLLVLGTEQKPLVRSLSCSGLGYKRTEQGWTVLSALITADEDLGVRAEAANAWPAMEWSVLGLCVRPRSMPPGWCAAAFCPHWHQSLLIWLLELATMAIADADASAGGAEILSRIVREGETFHWWEARTCCSHSKTATIGGCSAERSRLAPLRGQALQRLATTRGVLVSYKA